MPNPGLAYKIAELLSSSGPSSWPSAAAPANDVSIYGALRDIWDAVRNGTGGAEPATNRGIMDYLGASPAFCSPHFGFRVTKTEDVATATSDDLFTLTGKVAITLWTCEVTNALNASPTDYKIELTTLAGVLIAAGNIASSIVGHMFTLNGDAGDTSLSTSTSAVSDPHGWRVRGRDHPHGLLLASRGGCLAGRGGLTQPFCGAGRRARPRGDTP
jgi:hypothetical protein